MRRTALTAALVIAALLAAPVVGMTVAGTSQAAQTDNETSGSNASDEVAPGERLSGVVGVQEAELEGEVDRRAFGIEVARTNTDEARADVVADRLDRIEQRLTEIRERKAELDEARENGSMSEGEYRARVSELAAQGQTTKDLLDASNRTAGELPAEVLEQRGIDASAIQTLKNSAAELTGPEVAEIARSIAGPNVGEAPADVPVTPDETNRGGADNATDGNAPTPTPDGQETTTESDGDAGTDGTATETDTQTNGQDRNDSGR